MTAALILSYEWNLENLDIVNHTQILLSDMISFRGHKIFRVGIHSTDSDELQLFFVAINLHRLGLKVKGVMATSVDLDEYLSELSALKQQANSSINLQLFKKEILPGEAIGNCTFHFQIHIEGNTENYSYQLTDRLVKSQLWASLLDGQDSDIELIVKNTKFTAHKAILAVRSPVFSSHFAKEETISKMEIENVEPSTVEEFLYFLYTGECLKSFANPELRDLAVRYEVKPLDKLCQNALTKVDSTQILEYGMNFSKPCEVIPTLEHCQLKVTELYHDPKTFSLVICSTAVFKSRGRQPTADPNSFWQERFLLRIPTNWKRDPAESEFYFISVNQPNSDLRVKEVWYSRDSNDSLELMEERNPQNRNAPLLYFSSSSHNIIFPASYNATGQRMINSFELSKPLRFVAKIVSSMDNYYHEFMDTTWSWQLWMESRYQFTDVEIFVKGKKLEAHRFILSARSPVFNNILSNTKTGTKSCIKVEVDVEFDVFKHFLAFLYTGSLSASAGNRQLLGLAETYKVETLLELCKLHANYSEPDPEDITSTFVLV